MEKAKKGEFTDLAIRYKDRLTRFGYHYLHTFFENYGIKIHVLDTLVKDGTIEDELVEDLIAIVTSFAGKLHGARSGKNKLTKKDAKEMLSNEPDIPHPSKR
jgi:predicted site-specific integrase-resolvase